jgi:N-acetylmuramoyl-L-alanine amidase
VNLTPERTPLRPPRRQASPLLRQLGRHLAVTAGVAALLATVFTAWTPAGLNPGELASRLIAGWNGGSESVPVALATEAQGLRIGIVTGHSGPYPGTGAVDPGSTCADGLTELEVNQSIADLVADGLEGAGFRVDRLNEWDDRLTGYRAVALISIHADSCEWINDQATGFKVAASVDSSIPDRAQRLVTCLVDRYSRDTGLTFHQGSITRDMTEYHTFNEIHSQTPATIIETGFLNLDREFLTEHPDQAARGIVEGILCFVNNEPATLPGEATP